MASLRSEVLASASSPKVRPIIEKIKRTLSADERAELLDLVNDLTVSGSSIVTVLNKRGIQISEPSFYRLRRCGGFDDIA